jgi:hypothetical protein
LRRLPVKDVCGLEQVDRFWRSRPLCLKHHC